METHKGDNPGKYGRSAPNLVNRQNSTKDTVINVNGIEIGTEEIVVIAGPCAVENKEQILETARADGIMVEVHNKPLEALSDGQQSLYPEEFVQLVKDIDKMAQAMGRRLFLHKSLLA